jgi:GT2 family glycosyltransferase
MFIVNMIGKILPNNLLVYANKMLSIIIPVFNKINFTLSALNDLLRLQTNIEIIIVDNASTDKTQKEMEDFINSGMSNFNYIRNDTNLFHSKACNQGFAQSKGDYIIFLNNDIRIKNNHTNWTDILIPHCDDNIVGPTMGLLDGNFNFVKEANQQLSGNVYLSGWCLASSRENWKKLDIYNNGQIFDEQFPFYFNDTNMGFMCRKLGIPMKVVELPIVHFGKISASQLNIHQLYTQARQIFVKKWQSFK